MNDGIAIAAEALQAEVSADDQRIAALRREITEVQKERQRRQRALNALLKLNVKTAQGATQEVVRPIAQELLRDNEAVEYQVLYDLVLGRLEEAGLPTTALGLRMKELLSEPWVVETAAGVYGMRRQP